MEWGIRYHIGRLISFFLLFSPLFHRAFSFSHHRPLQTEERRKRTKDDQGRKLDHDIDGGKNTDELRRVVVSQKTNKGFFLD